MAITTSLLPIVPCCEGNEVADILPMPVAAAQTIKKGDVLYIIAGGAMTKCPYAATGATAVTEVNRVFGVAAESKAAIATVAATDTVAVWPAWQGRLFEAHLCGTDGTTDLATTATSAAIILAAATEHFQMGLATDVNSNTSHQLINSTTATLSGCRIVAFADGQPHDTTNWKTGHLAIATGAIGVKNPRVKFYFRSSFWTDITAGGTLVPA